MKKTVRSVYCGRCTHLLLAARKKTIALCVSQCRWVGDSLRPRVDVRGVLSPIGLNYNNECGHYRYFPSFKSARFKRWLLKKMDATQGRITDIVGDNHGTEEEEENTGEEAGDNDFTDEDEASPSL